MLSFQVDFEGRSQIRCVQQLGMLKLWERLKGAAELPDYRAVHGDDLERLRDKLMLLEVVWQEDEPRYLIRFQGADFARMYDGYAVGSYLDKVMSPVVREIGLPTYRTVVDRKCPAFNATPVRGRDGAVVYYERLLLPFRTTGDGVGQVFSIITLFSEDNRSPFQAMQDALKAGRRNAVAS